MKEHKNVYPRHGRLFSFNIQTSLNYFMYVVDEIIKDY